MQKRCNSSALAMELHLFSMNKPSIYIHPPPPLANIGPCHHMERYPRLLLFPVIIQRGHPMSLQFVTLVVSLSQSTWQLSVPPVMIGLLESCHMVSLVWVIIASVYSLAPGKSACDSKSVIFNLVLLIGIFRSSHGNALWWMPQDLTDDKSTLVQVMAWCHQATSHYLSQCWLSSFSPYGVPRPQWVHG